MQRRIVRQLQKSALTILGDTGLRWLLAPHYAGAGVIFMLHRVVPSGQPFLYPGYEVPADFLDSMLAYVTSAGWDVVSLSEMVRRLESGVNSSKRFVCFTLDDGYADNLTVAEPVFRRYNAPFAVYVTTGLIERQMFYWWGALEELILRQSKIEINMPDSGGVRAFVTSTLLEKRAAYDAIDGLCHKHNDRFFPLLEEAFARYDVDPVQILDRDAMTVDQVRTLARNPLATIGAHGVTHRRMSHMSDADLCSELRDSRKQLEGIVGAPIAHMAFPFGGRDACGTREFEAATAAGYRTAVTTRRGNLFPEHCRHLRCLPRRGFLPNLNDVRQCLWGVENIVRGEAPFVTA